MDTSFDMESPLTDEDIDADVDFKNVKVRRTSRNLHRLRINS